MDLPIFRSRRPIGAAAIICSAAVTIAGAMTAAVPGVAQAAGTPNCATSGLVVWLDTESNGAAGSFYYNLEFTNLSRRACTLRGYPGVSAVSLGGWQLGRAASRDNSQSTRTIRLGRGVTATALLRIVDVGVFSSSICRPTTAAGLRVFPPNQRSSKIIPFPFGACSRRGTGYLSVQSVQS